MTGRKDRTDYQRGKRDGAKGKPRVAFSSREYNRGYKYGQGLRDGSQLEKSHDGDLGQTTVDAITGREQIEKTLAGSKSYDDGYDRGKATYREDPDKVARRRTKSSGSSRASSGGGGGGGGIGGTIGTIAVFLVGMCIVGFILHWARYNTAIGLRYEKVVNKSNGIVFSPSDGQSRIYKFDIESQTESEFLLGRDIAFSPDGKKVAIIRKDSFGERTWVGNADGSDLRYIEKTGSFYWSYNSKRLLYRKEWRKENGFGYVDVWNRENQYVGTGSKAPIEEFTFSSGQDIAYVAKGDQGDSLHLTRTNCNIWKTPSLFIGKNMKVIGWSHDAQYLAIFVYDTSFDEDVIMVLRITGQRSPYYRPNVEVEKVLAGGVLEFDWCPVDSGKAVVNVSGVIMIFTHAIKRLEGIARGSSPAWSPDGKKIAFSHRGSLCLKCLDGNSAVRLVDDVTSFTWGPNSKEIYFQKG